MQIKTSWVPPEQATGPGNEISVIDFQRNLTYEELGEDKELDYVVSEKVWT